MNRKPAQVAAKLKPTVVTTKTRPVTAVPASPKQQRASQGLDRRRQDHRRGRRSHVDRPARSGHRARDRRARRRKLTAEQQADCSTCARRTTSSRRDGSLRGATPRRWPHGQAGRSPRFRHARWSARRSCSCAGANLPRAGDGPRRTQGGAPRRRRRTRGARLIAALNRALHPAHRRGRRARHAARAEAIFERLDRPALQVRALAGRSSWSTAVEGRVDAANAVASEALALARQCGDLFGQGQALNLLTFHEADLARRCSATSRRSPPSVGGRRGQRQGSRHRQPRHRLPRAGPVPAGAAADARGRPTCIAPSATSWAWRSTPGTCSGRST